MSAERFRRWFEFEKDAHARVFASLEALGEEQRQDDRFQKCVGLLSHIAAARELWLFRFGISESGPVTFDELFPSAPSLGEARAAIESMETKWESYLSRVDDDELARVFEYASVEGPKFKNAIEDLLTQLFGHSFYHRGQIAALVRSLGGEPAVTDYVFWTREPA